MKVKILMGLPGSGKSSWSRSQDNVSVINQDLIGSRKDCIYLFKEYLVNSYFDTIIVDRCNINKSQRKIWIDIAKDYDVSNIGLIWFKTPVEECIKRVLERKNHLTITNDLDVAKKESIVYNFSQSLEIPTLDEGFSLITIKGMND